MGLAHRFLLGLSLIALFAGGCATTKPVDLVANGSLVSQGSKTETVELLPPVLEQDGKFLAIHGVVRRLPGEDESVPGYILLTAETPEGELIDQLNLSWSPKEIPTTGDRQSTYGVRWTKSFPRGSVVRVALSTAAILPDYTGGSASPRGIGQASGIGTGYTRTPSQPTARPSQPQQPRQPTGGGR